jgi:hypothetical protein
MEPVPLPARVVTIALKGALACVGEIALDGTSDFRASENGLFLELGEMTRVRRGDGLPSIFSGDENRYNGQYLPTRQHF